MPVKPTVLRRQKPLLGDQSASTRLVPHTSFFFFFMTLALYFLQLPHASSGKAASVIQLMARRPLCNCMSARKGCDSHGPSCPPSAARDAWRIGFVPSAFGYAETQTSRLKGLYCVFLKFEILIKAFFRFLVNEKGFVWQGSIRRCWTAWIRCKKRYGWNPDPASSGELWGH